MDAQDAIASYAAALTDTIALTRIAGEFQTVATGVRARAMGYAAHEITGTVMQGDVKVIVLKADLDAQGWPTPIKKGDKITIDGTTTLTVETVDRQTRKVGTTLIAYECQARGS